MLSNNPLGLEPRVPWQLQWLWQWLPELHLPALPCGIRSNSAHDCQIPTHHHYCQIPECVTTPVFSWRHPFGEFSFELSVAASQTALDNCYLSPLQLPFPCARAQCQALHSCPCKATVGLCAVLVKVRGNIDHKWSVFFFRCECTSVEPHASGSHSISSSSFARGAAPFAATQFFWPWWQWINLTPSFWHVWMAGESPSGSRGTTAHLREHSCRALLAHSSLYLSGCSAEGWLLFWQWCWLRSIH